VMARLVNQLYPDPALQVKCGGPVAEGLDTHDVATENRKWIAFHAQLQQKDCVIQERQSQVVPLCLITKFSQIFLL